MKRVVRQTIALPVDSQAGMEEDADTAVPSSGFTAGRFGPAIGVGVAFTASILLWSVLANVIRIAYHSVF